MSHTHIITFSNINYNCAGESVREDMPVEGGLQGCIWWDASWCLMSFQLTENKSSALAHSTLHTQTMAAGGTCHAQRSKQMHLGEIQTRFMIQKLESSYFIYPERCRGLLASAWAFGPSNILVITSQIIKSKNVSWEMTQILSLPPHKGKKIKRSLQSTLKCLNRQL